MPYRGLLALLMLAIVPLSASAHAVHVVSILRDGSVEVEAFYDDNTPAIKAKVEVQSAAGKIIAAGATDDKGRWTFAAPAPGRSEIHLDAGAGHRAKGKLAVPEFARPEQTIGTGPTRRELTDTPWRNVLVGLVLIAGGGAAFTLATMILKKNKNSREKTQNTLYEPEA